jgi:hypothetical protein
MSSHKITDKKVEVGTSKPIKKDVVVKKSTTSRSKVKTSETPVPTTADRVYVPLGTTQRYPGYG